MGNILKMNDFVGAGFERLDDNLIEQHPPAIKWGQLVRNMNRKDQIRYYQRLASTMNHAARLVQNERNEALELCEKKEKQLISMSQVMNRNSQMLQSEITRLNEDRQQMLKAIAEMRAELRVLKAE